MSGGIIPPLTALDNSKRHKSGSSGEASNASIIFSDDFLGEDLNRVSNTSEFITLQVGANNTTLTPGYYKMTRIVITALHAKDPNIRFQISKDGTYAWFDEPIAREGADDDSPSDDDDVVYR